jgi:hypothetical protein
MLKSSAERNENPGRLLAKLVRDELRLEPAISLADLTDRIKTRCARLRIPCTAEAINSAYTLVGSNRPLVDPPPALVPAIVDEPPPIDRATARAILAELRARVGTAATPRRMPKARLVTPHTADQAHAMRIVLEAITETAARCEALEAAVAGEEG